MEELELHEGDLYCHLDLGEVRLLGKSDRYLTLETSTGQKFNITINHAPSLLSHIGKI
jgi:hypothetical protein